MYGAGAVILGVVKSRIMYVELKTGHMDNGPAWIGRVTFSKTGQTIYSRGKSLRKIPGGGVSANYRDVDTGEQYWISGVKKNREDRHWAGAGAVEIDEDVVNRPGFDGGSSGWFWGLTGRWPQRSPGG